MTTERAGGKRRYDHDAEESTVYKKRKEDRAQRAKKHAQMTGVVLMSLTTSGFSLI